MLSFMNDLQQNGMDDSYLLSNLDMMENFENLQVDNMYMEGDELNIDLNINIEIPQYLAEASMLYDSDPKIKTLKKQNSLVIKQSKM